MDPRALEIYTDGSSKIQLGCKAGCAFAFVYPEHTGILEIESVDYPYHISKIGAMEIEGINWALEWLCKSVSRLRALDITSAIIHCDNQYVVDSANRNINYWMNNGYKKKDGGDIANLTAWKRYASLKRKIQRMIFTLDVNYVKKNLI